MNPLKNPACLFVSGLLALTIVSCNHSDPDPTPIIPNSVFSAKVDGKTFYGGGISASVSTNSISVQSTTNEGTSKQATIILQINKFTGLTSYVIDTNTKATYTESGVVYRATTGSINITTSNDVHVAGNFAFEVQDTMASARQITSGIFDVYK